MTDQLLVHFSDLHVRNEAPDWLKRAERQLHQLAQGNEVVALTITGDLVDTPRYAMGEQICQVLDALLRALNLTTNGDPDYGKLLIVPGNHDFKTKGVLPRPFRRPLPGPKRDVEWTKHWAVENVSVWGLDSSPDVFVARGTVAIKLLDDMVDFFDSQPEENWRVVLVHHHVLPMPSEMRRRKLKEIAQDEAGMLLSNAGMVLAALMEAKVDVLLHGHRHYQHTSTYTDYGAVRLGRSLLIGSVTRASKGFQVLRFRPDGHLDLEPYTIGNTSYQHQPSETIRVRPYDASNRVKWTAEAETMGWYEAVRINGRLSAAGDTSQSIRMEMIWGGSKPIESIQMGVEVGDAALGSCSLDSATDLKTDEHRHDLPVPGPSIHYEFGFQPRIDKGKSHPGVAFERSGINTYASCMEDTENRQLRSHPQLGSVESFTWKPSRPVERLLMSFAFPTTFRLIPSEVRLEVESTHEHLVPQETERARLYFRTFLDEGLVILDLPHARPCFSYVICWVPPHLPDRVHAAFQSRIARSEGLVERLIGTCAEMSRREIQTYALAARNELLNHPAIQRSELRTDPAEIALALLVFDGQEGCVRTLIATYDENSPRWDDTRGWGVGQTGTAMRRGVPNAGDSSRLSPGQRAIREPPPQGVAEDIQYLAVPVELASDELPLPEVPPIFYKAVMVVHSRKPTALLTACREEGDVLARFSLLVVNQAATLASSILGNMV